MPACKYLILKERPEEIGKTTVSYWNSYEHYSPLRILQRLVLDMQ
jgi:hypothetical protein